MKFLIFFLTPIIVFSLTFEEEYMFEDGKQIFEQTCISCHGKNGETDESMQLVVKPRKLKETILTEKQSYQIIKEGAHFWGAHSGIMPSFKSIYSDDTLKSVAFYISKAFNATRDEKIKRLLQESQTEAMDEAKMLKIGQKIFKRNCSLCHGLTGNGKSDYVEASKKNEQFIYPYNLRRTLLSEDQIFLYAKYGGYFWGTAKTDMPAWKKKYNDEELKSVARYVYLKIKQVKE